MPRHRHLTIGEITSIQRKVSWRSACGHDLGLARIHAVAPYSSK